MMATFVCSTDLYIHADNEDEARDGLLHWLNEMARRDDSSLFDLIRVAEDEEEA